MKPIVVPKPKSVWDPNRLASSLLLAQVHHLREAEKSLPADYHSGIFHKSVSTEGEAARYIRAVTEAIHAAHADAAAARTPRVPKKQKRVLEIAAVADTSAGRKKPARKKAAQKTRRKR